MFNPKMFFISNEQGKKSATLTAFTYGFVVVCLKLIFSGVEIGPMKLSDFSGLDFGACVGSLGGIYVLNKRNNEDKKAESEPK